MTSHKPLRILVGHFAAHPTLIVQAQSPFVLERISNVCKLSDMVSPSMSLLLPTRGRPTLVDSLFRGIAETTSQPERVEVI